MNLKQRIQLLVLLGKYIKNNSDEWKNTKKLAYQKNGWFTEENIDLAANTIADAFLDENKLKEWTAHYQIAETRPHPKNIGIVMAGNIPLVGFHDFLSAFITGHQQTIKLSESDNILLKHLVARLAEMEPEIKTMVTFADMLKDKDAYIATGSNNSGRYFELYFSKYPHIIRRNRTSVALLTGQESPEELTLLADDMQSYFGLGCRNVTKLYVPKDYDFIPLINALGKYSYYIDNQKYKNNFDYQLAILLLNKQFYMTGGSLLLKEDKNLFAPVSVANYEYYDDIAQVQMDIIQKETEIQCVVGRNYIPLGSSQSPRLTDYADGIDTIKFLDQL